MYAYMINIVKKTMYIFVTVYYINEKLWQVTSELEKKDEVQHASCRKNTHNFCYEKSCAKDGVIWHLSYLGESKNDYSYVLNRYREDFGKFELRERWCTNIYTKRMLTMELKS